MAKKWIEVEANPEYRALTQQEKKGAQREYFNDVVAPQVPEPDREGAWAEFQASVGPSLTSATKEQLFEEAAGYSMDAGPLDVMGRNIKRFAYDVANIPAATVGAASDIASLFAGEQLPGGSEWWKEAGRSAIADVSGKPFEPTPTEKIGSTIIGETATGLGMTKGLLGLSNILTKAGKAPRVVKALDFLVETARTNPDEFWALEAKMNALAGGGAALGEEWAGSPLAGSLVATIGVGGAIAAVKTVKNMTTGELVAARKLFGREGGEVLDPSKIPAEGEIPGVNLTSGQAFEDPRMIGMEAEAGKYGESSLDPTDEVARQQRASQEAIVGKSQLEAGPMGVPETLERGGVNIQQEQDILRQTVTEMETALAPFGTAAEKASAEATQRLTLLKRNGLDASAQSVAALGGIEKEAATVLGDMRLKSVGAIDNATASYRRLHDSFAGLDPAQSSAKIRGLLEESDATWKKSVEEAYKFANPNITKAELKSLTADLAAVRGSVDSLASDTNIPALVDELTGKLQGRIDTPNSKTKLSGVRAQRTDILNELRSAEIKASKGEGNPQSVALLKKSLNAYDSFIDSLEAGKSGAAVKQLRAANETYKTYRKKFYRKGSPTAAILAQPSGDYVLHDNTVGSKVWGPGANGELSVRQYLDAFEGEGRENALQSVKDYAMADLGNLLDGSAKDAGNLATWVKKYQKILDMDEFADLKLLTRSTANAAATIKALGVGSKGKMVAGLADGRKISSENIRVWRDKNAGLLGTVEGLDDATAKAMQAAEEIETVQSIAKQGSPEALTAWVRNNPELANKYGALVDAKMAGKDATRVISAVDDLGTMKFDAWQRKHSQVLDQNEGLRQAALDYRDASVTQEVVDAILGGNMTPNEIKKIRTNSKYDELWMANPKLYDALSNTETAAERLADFGLFKAQNVTEARTMAAQRSVFEMFTGGRTVDDVVKTISGIPDKDAGVVLKDIGKRLEGNEDAVTALGDGLWENLVNKSGIAGAADSPANNRKVATEIRKTLSNYGAAGKQILGDRYKLWENIATSLERTSRKNIPPAATSTVTGARRMFAEAAYYGWKRNPAILAAEYGSRGLFGLVSKYGDKQVNRIIVESLKNPRSAVELQRLLLAENMRTANPIFTRLMLRLGISKGAAAYGNARFTEEDIK